MRLLYVLVPVAALVGCRDFSETEAPVTMPSDDDDGSGGSGGSGGKGGSGGEAGSPSDGGGGAGGDGGAPPFTFSCEAMCEGENHLCVIVETTIKPTGHLGLDGACSDDTPWKGRKVQPDPNKKWLVWDRGEVFGGTFCDVHLGLSDTGELHANVNGRMVYNDSSLCPDNTCVTDDVMKCCRGGKDLVIATAAGQPIANRRCVAQ